jgi:A/G-specific adenine glycosylase
MELGALICTPKQPKCLLCPVHPSCAAYRTGRVEQLPNLGPRSAATSRRFVALVINHRDRFLVRQRPAGIVNAHLWEFPNLETTTDASELQTLAARELNLKIAPPEKLCTIKHSITRYRITLEAFRAQSNHVSKSPPAVRGPRLSVSPPESRWLTLRELDHLAFTAAHRKILKHLAG